ncbi:Holo-[acyl-carrier-protein] synthase [Folsomia candida]|uniref:Holo-[acyl-carrier-protein] synthase n=1 Tax=Folsomia candida TaxID=158441 RepID=A0A226DG67_FOLCA|nr:Holo-[acyl-carrier-protein] synthase [Folsomia candida]
MRSSLLTTLSLISIYTISYIFHFSFSTATKPTAINLTESVFQHLDPDCHLILAHHNNFQNSDILSSPIPSKKGIYIFHLPQINVTTWATLPRPVIYGERNSRGIYASSQKAHFSSRAFCFIGVVITQKSDFDKEPGKLSDKEVSRFTEYQTNLLSFSRVLRNIRVGTAVFTFVLHVVVVLERDDWYETTPIWGWDSPVIQLDKKQIGQVISNNSHFYSIVERPTDFFLRTSRKSSLNLGGFYSRKESCGAYGKGPFYLIREERYRPRAVLLLSLVCLGNFTVGEAEDGSASTAKYNKNRDKEIFTYREQVNIYMHRQRTQFSPTLYVTTIKQGYSFITCFSTEDLSFKHT